MQFKSTYLHKRTKSRKSVCKFLNKWEVTQTATMTGHLVEEKNTLAAEKIVILRLVDGGDPCLKEGGA